MPSIGLILVAVVVVVIVLGILLFNNIVRLRNRVDAAWQTIDAQLQRRSDLIPNLVETVRGYATHESKTLEAVMAARNTMRTAPTPEAKMEANNELTSVLRQLMMVSESYPDLKANTNFLDLQNQLADTENRISYVRQSYNDTVLVYNNAIQTFPGVLVAGIGGFTPRTGFVADEGAKDAPQVKF